MEVPICKQPVPKGFFDALLIASHFKGRGRKNFPWLGFIELMNGKLYASDNRCIVEIDVGEDFGAARFSGGDIAVLKAMGDNPEFVSLNEVAAFSWGDGRWYQTETKLGSDLSERCQGLLDKYWHEGRKIEPVTSSAFTSIAKKNMSKVMRFKKAMIVQPTDQYWHCGSIAKVMRIATAYDPDATPAPFSFKNGRGLIIKPSQGRIKK